MNPFKLLGAYLGLAIGLILSFLIYSAIKVLCEFGGPCKPLAFVIPILPAILGFLIGWGIHIIIMRIRKIK